MATESWRIFSDIHFADRASRVRSLDQLKPLFQETDRVLLNGDTLDTRSGGQPARTAALRDEVLGFIANSGSRTQILTGNHDPDLSPHHAADLAGGAVFVTHGDVLFDDIVPWSRDAEVARPRIAAALAALPTAKPHSTEAILQVFRNVAASMPQRHQTETNPWKHLASFAADTLWPPDRGLRILRTWREAPRRAAAFARHHRPASRFMIMGHFHRPGIWRSPDGRWIINTGSFCPPLGGTVVDLADGQLSVRRIVKVGPEFRAGPVVAQFALAAG